MYLSQLTFHASDPVVLRALGDLHAMHRLILQGFPDEADYGRVLYRVERSQHVRDLPTVLVQSESEPVWTRRTADGRRPVSELARVLGPKPWEPRFTIDQMLRFRLHATPTVKRRFGEEAERPGHRRIGLHTEAEQRDWLLRKASSAGFEVAEVRVLPLGKRGGRSPRDGVITHTVVEFEGTLRVMDTALFADAVRGGVGAGKGFGFGLLSVMPAG